MIMASVNSRKERDGCIGLETKIARLESSYVRTNEYVPSSYLLSKLFFNPKCIVLLVGINTLSNALFIFSRMLMEMTCILLSMAKSSIQLTASKRY